MRRTFKRLMARRSTPNLYALSIMQTNNGYRTDSKPVSNATHTRAGHVAHCDPGTRLEVIAQIKQWLNSSDKQAAICWLSGPAGYGKSAVAQTIAERYAAKGRLLGCFFFLRGAGERSHISHLIPTLAHQISLSVPAVKPLLEKALRDEPDMLGPSASLAHQFQKLIIEPIQSTNSVLSSFEVFSHLAKQKIFVIDALDECNDKAEMAAFIDVLLIASSGRRYTSTCDLTPTTLSPPTIQTGHG